MSITSLLALFRSDEYGSLKRLSKLTLKGKLPNKPNATDQESSTDSGD